MTISECQTKIDQWIQTTGVRYFSELTNLGILMEEVGELSKLMVRTYGEQSFKDDEKALTPGELRLKLSDELADVLWVLICLSNQMNIDLTEALEKNFEKKNTRDKDRHKKNKKLK